jgi:hypothetical protein
MGLAAGGLACGSAIVDASGDVIAVGRNHAYDAAGPLETRERYALQPAWLRGAAELRRLEVM